MALVIGMLVFVLFYLLSLYLILKRVRGEDGRIDVEKLIYLMLKLVVIISGSVILAWIALMNIFVK